MSKAVNLDAEFLKTSAERKRHSPWIELLSRLVTEKPLGTVGLFIVAVMFLVSVFADWIAPYGMNEIHLEARIEPPSAQYILGTDNMGRDLFSRTIYGARISMFVGLGGTILATLLSLLIGVVSGFVGGKTDLIIQRFVDAFLSFPSLFLYLTVMTLVGPGLWQVIVVLGISRAIHTARVVRGAVIAVKGDMYVQAARAIGSSVPKIMWQHILPNIMAPVIILFTVSMGILIQTEATLSFLGFGVPPPYPSWGGMLSLGGRQFMLKAPLMAFLPGVALAITVYGINVLGDAVRDILDPRLKGGLGRYGRAAGKNLKKTLVENRGTQST